MCGLSYNPEASPPLSDSDSKPAPVRRVLRTVPPNDQASTKATIRVRKPTTSCSCEVELAELRKEVSELTKTINGMSDIIHAKLLFPHLSLAEALSSGTEVTHDHVKAPKRPRSDSALYLPDIPDGFSDSTAHSLVFQRRTKTTTAEQECKVAFKRLGVDSGIEEEFDTDTIVVKRVKAPVVRRGKVSKPVRASTRTRASHAKK